MTGVSGVSGVAWSAVPTSDGSEPRASANADTLETTEGRTRVACKCVGMTLLGLGIGCTFVVLRQVTGFHP